MRVTSLNAKPNKAALPVAHPVVSSMRAVAKPRSSHGILVSSMAKPKQEKKEKINLVNGMRIVTMQKREKLSKEELDELWFVEEPRKSREELLADPNIIPAVKKLIERSTFVAQRTEPWFKMRKGKVTGSAVASVLGRNPYQSKNKLMRTKLGLEPRFEGNIYTEYGNRMEPHAALAYQKKTGLRLIECDLGLMAHPDPDYDCIAASCDGVTTCGILIEIKCPYRRTIKPGYVPVHYRDQIQMNLFVHELDTAHFIDFKPASNGEPEICEITVVPRDYSWIKLYFGQIKAFSDELLKGLEDQKRKKRYDNVITVDLETDTDEKKEGITTEKATTFMFL